MERAMNDNQSDKGIRTFHVFFMTFSGVLILFGLALAGTMIYRTLQTNAQEAAQDIAVIARDENMQEDSGNPMPQMFPLPDTLGFPGGGLAGFHESGAVVLDMDSVEEERKDDLSLPLFDEQAEAGAEEKPFASGEQRQPEE